MGQCFSTVYGSKYLHVLLFNLIILHEAKKLGGICTTTAQHLQQNCSQDHPFYNCECQLVSHRK